MKKYMNILLIFTSLLFVSCNGPQILHLELIENPVIDDPDTYDDFPINENEGYQNKIFTIILTEENLAKPGSPDQGLELKLVVK